MQQYERLHDAGVVHGSPSPKNWLKRGASQITIVDFRKALLLYDQGRWAVPPEVGGTGGMLRAYAFLNAARKEMAAVRAILWAEKCCRLA